MPKKISFCRLMYTLFLLVPLITAKSQALVNSTGNTIRSTAFYVEYSIGEIAISTIADNPHQITQGLLQPNLKELPAQAIIVPVKRNFFRIQLRDKPKLPFPFLRITKYNFAWAQLNHKNRFVFNQF